MSLIPKTLFILSAAYFGLFETFGILVIAMGHFIYICLLTLIAFLTASQKSLLLQPYAEDGVQIYIDPNSKQSLYEFSWLTILKVILHEFEKIVLVVLDIAKNSSVYSLISGLGSIVVRYVYAPLD